jgi:hypothetical protein
MGKPRLRRLAAYSARLNRHGSNFFNSLDTRSIDVETPRGTRRGDKLSSCHVMPSAQFPTNLRAEHSPQPCSLHILSPSCHRCARGDSAAPNPHDVTYPDDDGGRSVCYRARDHSTTVSSTQQRLGPREHGIYPSTSSHMERRGSDDVGQECQASAP